RTPVCLARPLPRQPPRLGRLQARRRRPPVGQTLAPGHLQSPFPVLRLPVLPRRPLPRGRPPRPVRQPPPRPHPPDPRPGRCPAAARPHVAAPRPLAAGARLPSTARLLQTPPGPATPFARRPTQGRHPTLLDVRQRRRALAWPALSPRPALRPPRDAPDHRRRPLVGPGQRLGDHPGVSAA